MKIVVALFFILPGLAVSQSSKKGMVKEFPRSHEAVCHAEFKAIGCVSEEDIENPKCIEKKLGRVSPQCQSIHWERKKNK